MTHIREQDLELDDQYIEAINDIPSESLFYPDDEKAMADLLTYEWSLDGPSETDKHPPIYYDTNLSTTRENRVGSITVSAPNMQFPNIVGMGYVAQKHTRSMTVNIQVPKVRNRAILWVREVCRIISGYRMEMRRRFNGWDYVELKSVGQKGSYLAFYEFTVELNLVRNIAPLPKPNKCEIRDNIINTDDSING